MSGDNSLFVPGTDTLAGGSSFTGGSLSSGGDSLAGSALGAAGSLLGGVGSLLGGNAAAAGDTAAANGYAQEASLYNEAAQQAGEDIGIVNAGGKIQTALLQQKIQSTEATAAANEGNANISGPTTADILANSQRQGALAIGQQNLQTSLEASNFQLMQTGYEAQSAGATGEEQAAQAAAKASSGGGILGALTGVVGAAAKFVPFLAGL